MNVLPVFFLIVGAASMATATEFDCAKPRQDYFLMHGRYYKISSTAMNYTEAASLCQGEGTRLAVVEDQWLYKRLETDYLGNIIPFVHFI